MPEEKKYGRTFFDLIAEHPKITFAIVLLLVAALVLLAILRIPFKVSGVEVGDSKPSIHDTLVQVKTDTQFIERVKPSPSVVTHKAEPQKPIKEASKSVSVKTGDTVVEVKNQPANINTGTNNGIIGNDNKVNVSVDEVQRHLTDAGKIRLLELIRQEFDKHKEATGCVQVNAAMNNHEVIAFATEILQFLQGQNVGVRADLGQFNRSPIVRNVVVGVTPMVKNCVSVDVGLKP